MRYKFVKRIVKKIEKKKQVAKSAYEIELVNKESFLLGFEEKNKKLAGEIVKIIKEKNATYSDANEALYLADKALRELVISTPLR